MRVMVVCVPGVGHVAMMVPLAHRLQAGGHAVLLLTGPDYLEAARTAGLTSAAAGPTRNQARNERLALHPDSVDLSPREQQQFHVTKVWGGIYAPWVLCDLLTIAREWRPDILVYDVASFAGPLAAAVLGVPGVDHSFGPALPEHVLESAAEELSALWRGHGLPVPAWAGMLTGLHVDVWPSGLDLADSARAPQRIALRVVDARPASGDTVPDLVHVTLGTVFNKNPDLLRTLISAVDDLGLRVLLTTGPDQDPAVLGIPPVGVQVERFQPHAEVMPRCRVVISHSGAGTTLSALAHGLPSLLLPQAADGFRVAAGVVARGAGLSLEPHEVDVTTVRAAVRALLDDPVHRVAAQDVQREIRAMPGPDRAAAALEDILS